MLVSRQQIIKYTHHTHTHIHTHTHTHTHTDTHTQTHIHTQTCIYTIVSYHYQSQRLFQYSVLKWLWMVVVDFLGR